jgi:hypothetical protein
MSSTADKTPKAQTPSPTPEREGEGERDEAFLRRWSRRKHEVRAQEATKTVEVQEAQETTPPAEVSTPPVKVLTDADMPPLETLDEKSDFSMFLSSGVSDALRGQALRKLFLLPSINQRCPLDSEYYDCHGYTPLGNIITHEMREEMEREALKLKEAAMTALLDEKQVPVDTVVVTPAPEPTRVEPAPENVAAADQVAADHKDDTHKEIPT